MQTEAQHAVNTLILYRGDDAEFLSCACLWCEEIPAPSGAMDWGLTNPARAGMQQR